MVSVDRELCTGCGICIDLCSEIFTWGADGKAEATKSECDQHNVEEVADQCPVEAINV